VTFDTLLALGRVSNLPTIWTNVLAAAVLSGATLDPLAIVTTALALSSFYCGGMFLNDAFDRDVDAVERPDRPIPSGRATARQVFVLGILQLTIGVLALWATASARGTNPAFALAGGALLAGAIVTYDAAHKRNPFAPWIMGLCRALVYICTAAVLANDPRWPGVLSAAFALTTYTAGVTYVARVEATGRASRAWPLTLVAVAPLIIVAETGLHAAIVPVAIFTTWSVYALSRAFRSIESDVPGAITRAIAGMCLLDAAWAWVGGAHAIALIAACGLPLTRFAQRRVAGT
jgi:4-hydroxybenzoate polyprenyltransferase